MIRYSLFVLAGLAPAATALAAIAPAQAFPVYGPILVEQCATEDCSEVQS